MSKSSPSISAVLAVTSSTAFLELSTIPNVIQTFNALADFFPACAILVATTEENAAKAQVLLDTSDARYEILICQTREPASLAQALQPRCGNFDAILIHDASRPLVDREQFLRVLDAFDVDVDAVRPAMPYTETLKVLSTDSIIKETLDRSTVLRISTPELIRVSAIDLNGSDCGWFLPLKKGARTKHIEGSPDGLRINTSADRDLLELHQN